ncbi:hypothetical protein ACIGEP_13170 [Microbacterium sp. NPDC077663]|uniref:hypothetical protein n=1 Tax=Microbacterium sp. NPDC077663 TaxID=3364189 RepID=UPI0037CA709E
MFTYLLGTTYTLATAKADVDKAVAGGYWINFTVHTLGTGTGSGYFWTVADFTELVDYIASTNMPVLPMDEAILAMA